MAQNQCIFEYCNFGKGYLRLYFPAKKNVPEAEIMISLEDYPMEDGVVIKLEPLAERIKFEMNKHGIQSVSYPLLLLRSADTYRTSLNLPVKNSWQAKNLYAKEMKGKINKDAFYTVNNSYKSENGYIFNTYYMGKDVVESFIKLTKLLNTEVSEVQPYGMYLAQTLDYSDNFVFFHIRDNVCTMILVSQKDMITTYDFEFESSRDIVNKFILVASKHEFEFERLQITHMGVSADNPVDIKLGLKKLGEVSIEEADGKTELEKSLAKSIKQKNDELEVDWENYDNDKSTFNQRYDEANSTLKSRYDTLSKLLLSYNGMKCKVSDQAASFHINSKVYARMDIRENRVMLYLATDPVKYVNSRYPCALSKRRGFADTPCLYRIATAFRYEGSFTIIEDLVAENGLIQKPQ